MPFERRGRYPVVPDLPALYIMLLTYAAPGRESYAEKTLRATLERLTYSGDTLVHIADDGSSQEHRDRLKSAAREYDHVKDVTMTNSERGGYGRNYNLATHYCHNVPLVLPLEDDWELREGLNIDSMANDLLTDDRIGCIRMGYVGWLQPYKGEFFTIGDRAYILFDPASEELHVFSGHPRLETTAWARNVGLWDTGKRAGETEIAVSFRPEARTGVAWPVHLTYHAPSFSGPWLHFGGVKSEA